MNKTDHISEKNIFFIDNKVKQKLIVSMLIWLIDYRYTELREPAVLLDPAPAASYGTVPGHRQTQNYPTRSELEDFSF